MAIVAFTSSRGSPGVTSLAVGVALSLQKEKARPLLIEADPAGGVLGLRFDLAREPSLATLAGEAGRGASDSELLFGHTVDFAGFDLLAAPSDGLITNWALNRSTNYLSDVLRSLDRPVVIDLGRLDATSPALSLASVADAVVTVCRPSADEAQAMMFGVRTLRNHSDRVGLVTIGDRPFVPHEIADLAAVPLFAVLPDDQRTSKAFLGGKHSVRTLRRSLLWRSIDSLTAGLYGSDWTEPQRQGRRKQERQEKERPFSAPAPTGAPVRAGVDTERVPPPPTGQPIAPRPSKVAAPDLLSPQVPGEVG